MGKKGKGLRAGERSRVTVGKGLRVGDMGKGRERVKGAKKGKD